MTPSFSIVMTLFERLHLLPRALTCVFRQTYTNWELLLVADGPTDDGPFAPRPLVDQIRRACPRQRIEMWQLPRQPGCHGNVGRHFALQQARGDYVCWVNHDNLIYPGYLAAHVENIARSPGCLSVIDVDLWEAGTYRGVFPQKMARSRIDLLCYAVPLETARQVDAFGGQASRVYAADWITFDACRQRLQLEHNRNDVVGAHF